MPQQSQLPSSLMSKTWLKCDFFWLFSMNSVVGFPTKTLFNVTPVPGPLLRGITSIFSVTL